jgi:hypothetical protein
MQRTVLGPELRYSARCEAKKLIEPIAQNWFGLCFAGMEITPDD